MSGDVLSDVGLLQRRLQALEDDVAHLIAVVDAHADLLQSIGVLAGEFGVGFDSTRNTDLENGESGIWRAKGRVD